MLSSTDKWSRDYIITVIGKALADCLQLLGPVYLKIGQYLSVRRDLIPKSIIDSLSKLQNQVRPLPANEIIPVLEEELGVSIPEYFQFFDWKPIASGSIAQVYRAKIHNTDNFIAVKVKRPGIDEEVEKDLSIILFLTKILQRLPYFKTVPLISSVKSICYTIYSQIDFKAEASSIAQANTLFLENNDLILPKIVSNGIYNSIILMNFIDETQKIDCLSISQNKFKCSSLILLNVLYSMIFSYGFIHCDLHPGNVQINSKNQIVLFDFGMVAILSTRIRFYFRDFFHAIITNQGNKCANIILETAISVDKKLNLEDFKSEIKELISNVSGMSAGKFRVISFVNNLFDIQRKNKICSCPFFIMALVSLAQFEGLVIHRFPELNFQEEARKFFTYL